MTDWTGERVLVTGGAGFIGSHLVDMLVAAGAEVTILDNLSGRPHVRDDDVVLMQRNMPGAANVNHDRWDVIFHFAANAYVPPSVEYPVTDFRTNCKDTLYLLEALRIRGWKGRFIYASSAAVYGNPTWSPVREDHPTVPVSPYGCGKLASERYCDVYAKLYGLNIASLRIFSIYGPRQYKQVVFDLMVKTAVAAGRNAVTYVGPDDRQVRCTAGPMVHIHGDGTQIRDFTYVTDAARAAMTVAERGDFVGEVYNVGSGEDHSIAELAEKLRVFLGGGIAELCYTGVNRPGDPEKLSVDITRLRALQYEPHTSFDDGLAATVKWFNEEVTWSAAPK